MHRTKKPTLSAEEKAARELKARRRFKAVVRLVMANLFWLGDLDDTLGENVMLNIQKLTRKKIKKSTLTIKEKLVLTKPKEERTEEDKHFLNRAIGGLKCFRRYPPDVKSQLAAVTYFIFIGQDRIIVKQDHAPTAMYFMLSGEATVTVKTYDKMLKEWIVENHGTVGQGTMFGEVALIHGISRTATITTTMPCELLMIKKEDFDIVLKETVWKAWEQITNIMNRYSYFKNWDIVTKRECSIISRTKAYSPDETILGDDSGLSNYTYLVTKGTCCVIEHLLVVAYYIKGIKKYEFHDPEKDESRMVCDEETMTCVLRKPRKIPLDKKKKTNRSAMKTNADSSRAAKSKSNIKFSKTTFTSKTSQLETHFIKVCELSEGAVFNIGENLQRRRVVALTEVNCLLIPSYWLMKMNKGSIWTRVQQFLNKSIPSTEQLFKEWVEDKKFVEYRKSLVRDILAQKRVSNTNCIHNVPYSIRLKEGTSYDI